MDHGGMDHGGMDMPAMCNMNVRTPCLSTLDAHTEVAPDAFHVGHNESLHSLPLVAHPLDIHAPHLPRRRSAPHSWLRIRSRVKQAIRTGQHGICE